MSQSTPPKTYKLIIEYDGTEFHGWQRQKEDRTVQETIENALATLTQEKVTIIGSGRTDAGVHALGQVASFKTGSHLTADVFLKGLNSLLPNDVVIHACQRMPGTFHARFDVKSKRYRYYIRNHTLPSAIARRFVWSIGKPLNVSAMCQAASMLRGTHDFKAFEGTGSPRNHTIRTVAESAILTTNDNQVVYEIEADGFLRFMVRNIVGTLVEVGLGRIMAKDIQSILRSKDRSHAGATAPPQGLFLIAVTYR